MIIKTDLQQIAIVQINGGNIFVSGTSSTGDRAKNWYDMGLLVKENGEINLLHPIGYTRHELKRHSPQDMMHIEVDTPSWEEQRRYFLTVFDEKVGSIDEFLKLEEGISRLKTGEEGYGIETIKSVPIKEISY